MPLRVLTLRFSVSSPCGEHGTSSGGHVGPSDHSARKLQIEEPPPPSRLRWDTCFTDAFVIRWGSSTSLLVSCPLACSLVAEGGIFSCLSPADFCDRAAGLVEDSRLYGALMNPSARLQGLSRHTKTHKARSAQTRSKRPWAPHLQFLQTLSASVSASSQISSSGFYGQIGCVSQRLSPAFPTGSSVRECVFCARWQVATF